MARDKASLDNLDDLPPPDVLQQEIIAHLEAALAAFRHVAAGWSASAVVALSQAPAGRVADAGAFAPLVPASCSGKPVEPGKSYAVAGYFAIK